MTPEEEVEKDVRDSKLRQAEGDEELAALLDNDADHYRNAAVSRESRLRKIAEGLRLNIDTLNRTREKSIEIGKEELESLLALAKGETNG